MRLAHDHRRRTYIHTAAAEREGGYVLIMFALLLIPMMLFVGFSVDVGSWYNRASDMQKAADAASLAGVVWLPDEAKAREVALETAKKNGFDNADPNIDVTVVKSTKAPNRLKVTIRDRRVGSFVYRNLGGSDLDMNRIAFAEHVTPVPMGSPRNYFGTGHLQSAPNKELLYQSVNAYCTMKDQGDRHQAPFMVDCPNSGVPGSSNQNEEYWDDGYKIVVEAPAGRNSAIDIRLYDPRFNTAPLYYHPTTGANCTPAYPSSWTGAGSGTSKRVVAGPAEYQTRANTSSNWGGTVVLGVGQDTAYPNNRIRYRYQNTSGSGSTANCIIDGAPDSTLGGSGSESFRFTMYYPDTTPHDLTNNTVLCSTQSYGQTAAFANYRYLNSRRWVDFCSIPADATAGEYIIQIQNAGQRVNRIMGSNQWGMVAKYRSAAGDGLCDGRTDATCPRVYGMGAISVYAATSDGVASFYLAEIASQHAGKKLRLELWDPGEGGSRIAIQKPTGTNSWAAVPLSYRSVLKNGTTVSEDNVTSIDVSGSKFNGSLLEITVDLTGYSPPVDNNWWKIQYTFSDATRPNVTDRTTWSARILGDPVHLIEE